MDKIAIELSKLSFIETINELKREIDSHKPIAKEIEDKVFQKLKLDWNYNSNAIEGNKLNYGETVAFLMHGITAKGKTLKDHLDIKGHNEAINFLLGLVKEDRDISEADIRALHTMILVEEYDVDALTDDGRPTKKRIKLGVYKTSANSVKTRTGEIHHYASVEETPALMTDLMTWYNTNKENKEIHPLVLASLFHFKFVAIHPFDDGNGRLARILMNLILLRNNLPVVVVKNEDKQNYYGVLAQADSNQFIPLIEYMSDLLQHSLNIYLKGIRGESIEEESDIDKEIALLKKSIDKTISERRGRSLQDIRLRLSDSILILIDKFKGELGRFADLFLNKENNLFNIDDENYIKYGLISDIHKLDIDFVFRNKSGGLSLNNIEVFFNHIKREQLFYFEFQYQLNKLRNNESKSITKSVFIDFKEDKYKVKSDDNMILKYYNEKISSEEINTFVNAVMKDILQQIKQATKK